jgi:formate hydrogenlyase subunit 6/NADH:ubiquinone oxidoreductase subunit I
MLCVKDCPSDAVKITKIEEKHFSCTFNLGNCIYCGQCADSCAKKVISMSKEFELATFDRSTLTNTTDSDSPWLAVQRNRSTTEIDAGFCKAVETESGLPPPKVEETKPSSEEVACERPQTPETKV